MPTCGSMNGRPTSHDQKKKQRNLKNGEAPAFSVRIKYRKWGSPIIWTEKSCR